MKLNEWDIDHILCSKYERNAKELSDYFPSPKGLEEVGNIVEVDIAASAAYPVTRNENLLCIRMLHEVGLLHM